MTLTDVVGAAATAAATSSRLAKVAALAELFRGLPPDQVPTAIGLLLGKPRQGRTGVGWRTLDGVRPEPAPTASLQLADVDAALDRLAAAVGSGSGSTTVRATVLRDLLTRATSDEQDFLVRSLLGDVRTGALEGVVLDAIAAAAGRPATAVRRAAMLTGDLGETARRALTGDGFDDVGLTPGIPVLPMLASTAASPTAALEITGEASVEFKLDGARLQIHRVGGVVSAFTRTLADVTARVPEVVELVGGFPGGDLILDGETLTLGEDGRARPFADTMSRFGARSARQAQLSVWFFDLLHAGGVDLIDEPLRRRRAELEAVVGDRVVPGVITADPAAAEQLFGRALAAGHEGVLVKAVDSVYAAGRRGKSWVKVKPVHTYDLVVLAAEWGYGRRTGWLSNLHLGARDPDGEFGEPGGFVMVGKTFKGLTDDILRWQTEFFPTIESRRTGSADSGGAVFVEPTTVVEIAIDGVQRSSRYPGGVALRFARVKSYRLGDTAKPAEQTDTIDTLRALLAPDSTP
ncbi:ATP-dependent DNA ligase [Nakamurella lactea]|uniref:ATP-dependent DNA ligase n=1 Tax=Nakamurella lactea TaxID=459515 RepID=UPI0003F96FC1|nr:ATP-dependent DNA ligase [Nakamurella lactea]